jgi:hypothetical protein
MVHASHDSDLALHVVQGLQIRHVAVVGDLQCDFLIFDHVVGRKNCRETAFAKAAQDPIFVEPATDTQARTIVTVTAKDLQGGH